MDFPVEKYNALRTRILAEFKEGLFYEGGAKTIEKLTQELTPEEVRTILHEHFILGSDGVFDGKILSVYWHEQNRTREETEDRLLDVIAHNFLQPAPYPREPPAEVEATGGKTHRARLMEARRLAQVAGYTLTYTPAYGEYRLAPYAGTRQQREAKAYYTSDLNDAVQTAQSNPL